MAVQRQQQGSSLPFHGARRANGKLGRTSRAKGRRTRLVFRRPSRDPALDGRHVVRRQAVAERWLAAVRHLRNSRAARTLEHLHEGALLRAPRRDDRNVAALHGDVMRERFVQAGGFFDRVLETVRTADVVTIRSGAGRHRRREHEPKRREGRRDHGVVGGDRRAWRRARRCTRTARQRSARRARASAILGSTIVACAREDTDSEDEAKRHERNWQSSGQVTFKRRALGDGVACRFRYLLVVQS